MARGFKMMKNGGCSAFGEKKWRMLGERGEFLINIFIEYYLKEMHP